jgi:hypothetical protein
MSFDLNPDDEHVRAAIELLYWLLGIPVPKRESPLSGSVEKRKRLKPLLIWPEAFQTW